MILKNVISDLARDLEQAGIESSSHLAERVVMEVLGFDRAQIFLNKSFNLDPQNIEKIDKIKKRLLAYEPLTKILGKAYFWKYEFIISEHVLDPRADSELLIDLILKKNKIKNCNILDLGTGSGCLLISLLNEYPNVRGIGLEISSEAAEIALKNLQKHHLMDRGAIVNKGWQSYDFKGEKYDIVVSNPPYIADFEKDDLDPAVILYDPHLALFAPEGGLKYYREIAAFLSDILTLDGLAIFEIGHTQAVAVKQIFKNLGFIIEGVYQDLAGKDRAIIVQHKHK